MCIGSLDDLPNFFRFADEINIPVAVEEELFDAVLLLQAQGGQLVERAVQQGLLCKIIGEGADNDDHHHPQADKVKDQFFSNRNVLHRPLKDSANK